jgi:hypothetical protein
VLSKADERLLCLFERRVLRCIFGAVQDKGTWRNCVSFLMSQILLNTLSWAGHIIRMENSRTAKKVFVTRPEGTKMSV